MEVVKEFSYFEIVFQRNGNVERHMRERVKRGSVILNVVWSRGQLERKFKANFEMRMLLFDALVMGVM